jgi:DNA-binding NarL/FixJ family response regulator
MIKNHIIFLEDEPSVRDDVGAELQEKYPDWEIQTVETVGEAKKALTSSRRQGWITRVVIVDEKLEFKDREERGSDFLKYVHSRYPGIRKIMFTALAEPEDVSRALNDCSLDKYIIKAKFNDDHSILFDAIDAALKEEDRSVIYEAVAGLLGKAEEQGLCEKAILRAGKRNIEADELLRHISQETSLGRKHMKQFTQFLYSIFLDPDKFLEELERRKRLVSKKKRKSK